MKGLNYFISVIEHPQNGVIKGGRAGSASASPLHGQRLSFKQALSRHGGAH